MSTEAHGKVGGSEAFLEFTTASSGALSQHEVTVRVALSGFAASSTLSAY